MSQATDEILRLTTEDLELLPDNSNHYEINERRDKVAKLKPYSTRGVQEY